jgi:Fe2+ or Zn2+ uptake regulation protein
MDRASILGQSEQLERHIALVEEDLTRQREIVADLLRDDHDASSAMDLLQQFEALYARLIADRAIVRRKLDYATR